MLKQLYHSLGVDLCNKCELDLMGLRRAACVGRTVRVVNGDVELCIYPRK
jgi:hypothetical protein